MELETIGTVVFFVPLLMMAYWSRKAEQDNQDRIEELEEQLRRKTAKLDKLKAQYIGTKELRRRLLEYGSN